MHFVNSVEVQKKIAFLGSIKNVVISICCNSNFIFKSIKKLLLLKMFCLLIKTKCVLSQFQCLIHVHEIQSDESQCRVTSSKNKALNVQIKSNSKIHTLSITFDYQVFLFNVTSLLKEKKSIRQAQIKTKLFIYYKISSLFDSFNHFI